MNIINIIEQQCFDLIENNGVYGSDIINILELDSNPDNLKDSYEFKYLEKYTECLNNKLKTINGKEKALSFIEEMTDKFSNVLDLMSDQKQATFIHYFLDSFFKEKNNFIVNLDIKPTDDVFKPLIFSSNIKKEHIRMAAFFDYKINDDLLEKNFIVPFIEKKTANEIIEDLEKKKILGVLELDEAKKISSYKQVFNETLSLIEPCIPNFMKSDEKLETAMVDIESRFIRASFVMACLFKNDDNQIVVENINPLFEEFNKRIDEKIKTISDVYKDNIPYFEKMKNKITQLKEEMPKILIDKFSKEKCSNVIIHLQNENLNKNISPANNKTHKRMKL